MIIVQARYGGLGFAGLLPVGMGRDVWVLLGGIETSGVVHQHLYSQVQDQLSYCLA
jgi:hypothetical protein